MSQSKKEMMNRALSAMTMNIGKAGVNDNVIEEIKQNWKYDFAEPIETNSRAIASTICYMSRKRKMHELDG